MTFYDVMANGGTTTLGSAMAVDHNLTVNAGTFTTSAGNHGLTVAGDLAIAGTLRLTAASPPSAATSRFPARSSPGRAR